MDRRALRKKAAIVFLTILGLVLGAVLCFIGPSGVYQIPTYLGVPLPHLRPFGYGGLYYVSEYQDAYIWDTKQQDLRIEWRAGWHWCYPLRDNVYIYETPGKEPTFFALLDEARLWDKYYDAARENLVPLASDEELKALATQIYPRLVEAGIVESMEEIHEPHIRFVLFDKRARYLYAGMYAWFTDSGVIDRSEERMSDVVDINRAYRKGGVWEDTPIAEVLAHELSHAQGVPGSWWESQNTLIGMEIAATELEDGQWIAAVFGNLKALARDYAYWMMEFTDVPPKSWGAQVTLWMALEEEAAKPWEASERSYDYGDPLVVAVNNVLQGRHGWKIVKEADWLASPLPSLLSGERQIGRAIGGYTLIFETKRWEAAFNQMIMDTYQLPRDLQRYHLVMSHRRQEGGARMQQMMLEYEIYPYTLLSRSMRLNEPLIVLLIEGREEYPDEPGKWGLRIVEVNLNDLASIIQKYLPMAVTDVARE